MKKQLRIILIESKIIKHRDQKLKSNFARYVDNRCIYSIEFLSYLKDICNPRFVLIYKFVYNLKIKFSLMNFLGVIIFK